MSTPQSGAAEKKKRSRKRRSVESAFSKYLEPETRETLSKEDHLRDEIEVALKQLSLKGDQILEIQDRLIEEDVGEKEFFDLIPELSAGHYSEVVDERADRDKCAFPTCKSKLNPNMPLKISTAQEIAVGSRNHKSFRKYCSFECLRKSTEILSVAERNPKNLMNVQSFLQSVQEKMKQDKSISHSLKQTSSPNQQKARLLSPNNEKQSLILQEKPDSAIVENEPAPPSTIFAQESHSAIENHQPRAVAKSVTASAKEGRKHVTEKQPSRKSHKSVENQVDSVSVVEKISSAASNQQNKSQPIVKEMSVPVINVRPLPKPRKVESSEDLFGLSVGTRLFVSALIRKWRTAKTIEFWVSLTGNATPSPIQGQQYSDESGSVAAEEAFPPRFPIVDSISKSRKRKDVFFDFIDPLLPKLVLALEIEPHLLLRSKIVDLIDTFDMNFGLPALKNHHHLAFLLTFVYSIGRYIPSVWASIQAGLADWNELVQVCGLTMEDFESLVRESSL